MINSGDIINYQSDIWLSQEYILEHTGVSYSYLRVAKTRAKKDETKSWQHTELMNRCYFSYSALPRTASTQLSPLNKLIAHATELHDDVTSIVTAATINRYKLFLASMPIDLAKSAAVIHEASIYCKQNGISFSKSQFFERLGREIDIQGLKYLPRTWRNLRDKVRDYASGTPITELVAAKNEGNNNRAAYANNELIKGWLIELADSQKNYSYAFMWRKIRTICQQYGINKVPSQRWVSDFVAKPETQFLIQERYGVGSRFNHKYRSYTPTQSALFAGDCWDIDGTRINIIDHRGTYRDKKSGKKVTGQKFLYIIAVRDVMSGLVLGWEYCYEESAQAVINALAMAVSTSGYLPYEIRYDRFPGHNTEDWAWVETGLQQADVTMTQTVKAEGKAKIERWWETLQSVFMMESDLFYGEGVKSTRRYAHRSKEYVAAMRQKAMKAGFNFDDAVRETDSFLERYANTPYSNYSTKFKKIDKSPFQLHDESDKPNTIEIEEAHYCYLFGMRKEVSIRNNMIMTQIANATYYYAIDDVEMIEKYTGTKLLNCFDFEDLEQVHLFDGEDYLGTFNQITPAQQYGPDKDMRAVGKMKSIAEKANNYRKVKALQIEVEKEELLQASEPEEVSSELGVALTGHISKHDYEAAETAYLHQQWEDEEELNINIKKQY